MDKHMLMNKYYELDHAGRPSTAKLFDDMELDTAVRGCPTCNRAVDDISRYSRCVKGNRLDASAKKIIEWVRKSYVAFRDRVTSAIQTLKTTVATAAVPQQAIALCGEREQQLAEIFQLDRSMNTTRYEAIDRVRMDAYRFGAVVQNLIKPYHLLHERLRSSKHSSPLVENLLKSVPELGGFLMWPAALIELCELAIITDVVARAEKKKGQDSRGLRVDFKTNRAKCQKLVQQAEEANMVLQQVQGMAMWAQYAILKSRFGASEESLSNQYLDAEAAIRFGDVTELVDGYNARLEKKGSLICLIQARSCMSQIRSSAHMDVPDINYLTFDDNALTGSWFRCVNGHIFEGVKGESKVEGAVCEYCGDGISEKEAEDGESEGSDIVVANDAELLNVEGQ